MVQVCLVLAVILSTVIMARHAKQSNDAYSNVSSMELMFKLNERIYDSQRGKYIIEQMKDAEAEVIDLDEPNLYPTHREVENFLNDVEAAFLLKERGILTDDMFKREFSWVVNLVVENKNIMNFIEAKQKEYGEVAWKPISDYYHQKRLGSSS